MARMFKCYYCGAVFNKFRYKYDSTPRGDDEIVCPKCGHDDGFEEVKDETGTGNSK